MSKQWVFTALVEDESDQTGLFAYALYKLEKNQYAEILNGKGLDSDEIDKRVQQFHDQVIDVPMRVHSYRLRGEEMIRHLMEELEVIIRQNFEEQINSVEERLGEATQLVKTKDEELQRLKKTLDEKEIQHKKDIEAAKIQAVVEFYRAAGAKEKKKTNGWLRALFWFLNGFQGVFAALAFAIVIYGIAAQFLSSDDRGSVISLAWKNFISVLTSSPAPSLNNEIIIDKKVSISTTNNE
ncbi:TPA: hypothetical protein ACV5OD_001202 [Citrobacter freundii]|uniref:hypothetical protein n=1 Tax=Citrobacter freundii complex TaxID=1344959 RepID=UPI001BAD3445|nr:hypothetical protein [Citrobacter portucalensis]HBH7007099.1 hypothetical protein [Citrobacter freundii]